MRRRREILRGYRMTIIIIICVLVAFITTLVLVLVKNMVSPKKLDAVPKLIKQGKTLQAIKIAKQIIAKDPKNYLAHYYLGKAYIKDNRPELALIEYKTVDENALFGEGIDEAPFRKEYANLLLKYNQQNEALKNFLLLTKQAPNDPDNFFQAGIIYEQQNRYDIALGLMQKCAMLDKKHAKAHAEIGYMYYRTKKFNEAKKEIDVAIKLSPDTYSAYYYLGKIYKDAKDPASALKAFEKAQRDPDMKQKAIIEHGACYLTANKLDSAIIDFQRAIELDKSNSQAETLYARYFLANCYEKLRKIDKAIEQWEEIYKKNKSFRDTASKLSEYKDLQNNDFLKDYLTGNNEEFAEICKKAVSKVLNMQILTCDITKMGCQITAVNKGDDARASVRKQIVFFIFYRDPETVTEQQVQTILDLMKSQNGTKGYIFSSSGFNAQAKRYAENRSIELVEKQKLEAILTKAGE